MLTSTGFDVGAIRLQFPYLARRVNGKPITYLDNAATSQKPQSVIDAIAEFYSFHCANVHRGDHLLSQEASEFFEEAREKVASFINCSSDEIVFVRNATEAINLVQYGLLRDGAVLHAIDEHHSNILPWRNGVAARQVAIDEFGRIDLDDLARKIDGTTRLLSVSVVSNAFGHCNPIERIGALARAYGVPLLLDASQAIGHMPIAVESLGCDFMVFSAHKAYGPMGIGVLYMRSEWHESLRPFLAGGGTVKEVTDTGLTYEDAPHRFEAGTPNVAGAVGLAAAIEFIESIGIDALAMHEHEIAEALRDALRTIPRIHLHGAEDALPSSIVNFTVEGLDSHFVARHLSAKANVMVRAGFHCAHLLHRHLNLGPTIRASVAVYNTFEEVETLAEALRRLVAAC